jgi:thiamine-phosphate pyrophosphorylase
MGPDPLRAIRELCACVGSELAVQIREKDLPSRTLYTWIEALLPHLNGARLLINGRADVALCFAGVGVHLPEDGLPLEAARHLLGERPIGVSTHSASAAVSARRAGADLVVLSPIFESPGKGAPLGLAALREAAPAGNVYALGGVGRSNLAEVLATGVEGVAAIRAAWSGELVERDDDADGGVG